jgi:hypothetical protein
MKRELFYVLCLVKGGRIQLQVLKGENTIGCSDEAAVEMLFFECQVSLFLCHASKKFNC